MDQLKKLQLMKRIQRQKDRIVKEHGGFHQSEDSLYDLGYLSGLEEALYIMMGATGYWKWVYSETPIEEIEIELERSKRILEHLKLNEPEPEYKKIDEKKHYIKHADYYDEVSSLVGRVTVAEEIIRKNNKL